MNGSHNVYCDTRHDDHKIWCVVSDVVATAVLFCTAYAVLSVGFIADAILVGGQ
jgi:hypothetical protein